MARTPGPITSQEEADGVLADYERLQAIPPEQMNEALQAAKDRDQARLDLWRQPIPVGKGKQSLFAEEGSP